MTPTKTSNKALVVLSGGQDSTTCLYWAMQKFDEIHAITFDYGQTHTIEIAAAKKIVFEASREYPGKIKSHEISVLKANCDTFHFNHQRVNAQEQSNRILKGTSPLVSDNALEQYKDFNSLPGGLEKTFVPMRNQLFLTLAANRAFCLSIANLVTGVCQEDSGGYPDCTADFIDALRVACNLGTFTNEAGFVRGLYIHTPLMDLTKAESIRMALNIKGCYPALAYSHTSYDGQYPPIGHDHATLLRAKGFAEAGIPDPLVVRAFKEDLMPLPDTENYSDRAFALIDNLYQIGEL